MQVNCDKTYKDPWDYSDFKSYWKDHRNEYKNLMSKNIIWRIIHYKNWISMNGTFMWKSFWIYSNPLIPSRIKGFISYHDDINSYRKVINVLNDELTKSTNTEILNAILSGEYN